MAIAVTSGCDGFFFVERGKLWVLRKLNLEKQKTVRY